MGATVDRKILPQGGTHEFQCLVFGVFGVRSLMGFSEEASECVSLYSPSLETRRPGSGSSWPVAVASHLSGLSLSTVALLWGWIS